MKQRIKEVRKEKGLTQEDLARRLNITRQGVSSLENSDSVTLNTLEKISLALNCYIHELMDTDDDFNKLFSSSKEYVEAYKDSLRKNIEDLKESREQDLSSLIIAAMRRLNASGLMLLYRIAIALVTTEGLVKEGKLLDINDDDAMNEYIEGLTNGGETEEN